MKSPEAFFTRAAPFVLRGGEINEFTHHALFDNGRSILKSFRARLVGDSTTSERPRDEDDKNDRIASTLHTTKSSSNHNPATTATKGTQQPGGAVKGLQSQSNTIQSQIKYKTNNTSAIHSKAMQQPMTEDVASEKAIARKVAKEQRKREKEAKKKHKQIAKQLRVSIE